MQIKEIFSDKRILNCLHTYYGVNITMLTSFPLGADSNSFVYKAIAQDNSSYFVKIKRGNNHDFISKILQLLHEAGIQQIILPIKTVQGHLNQNIDGFTMILYPFIEGQNGFSRNLTDGQWLTLGKTLRKIHEINVPPSIKQHIRQESFSSKWRDIVRSFYTKIEAKPSGDKVAQKLLTFMKKNLQIIQRLVDIAEQLAQILRNKSSQFVLCHSDIHGGNVLLNNTNIYLVDWDDPIMAPRERDLMFIGGGVANVWNKPHEVELFYKGYGKIEVNKTILAYYRYERIVEDIAEYGQELLLTTQGGKNRLEMYKHFIAMFEPRGVIEIAFETL